MATKRRARRRAPVADAFPVAALHYLTTGELMGQAEGEQRFGPSFNWLDPYDPAYHPRAFPAAWAQHRNAIEAHAHTLGITRHGLRAC